MSDLIPLSDDGVQALGWMLLHSLWQGLAVAAVLAVARAVVKDPRVRYTMSCAALLAIVAAPAATSLSRPDEPISRAEPVGVDRAGGPRVEQAPTRDAISAVPFPDRPVRLDSDRWKSIIAHHSPDPGPHA